MTSAKIRQSFLKYFESHGHRIVPSASLVPVNDPTLLFTNAGMNQFKALFLGTESRNYQRATSSQKCMRVSGKHNDLNNVGPSLQHHTFFEMLGNFSFGDYFKTEAIHFAWELLTKEWSIQPDRLYATVFSGEKGIPRDEEAATIWRQFLPDTRILELGLSENFWAMGDTGPCGRCSEVHYHRGNHLPCPGPTCLGINCNCDRYVEIWNNVFMEFDRQEDGSLESLPTPSIDTGMGLERIVALLQNTESNYNTDLFSPLLTRISELTGAQYDPLSESGGIAASNASMRVVADHMRAMTFLIADGVLPSNEWRGYVLRKIMRRAMRHGKKLGTTKPFLHNLVDTLSTQMGDIYPQLTSNRESISQVIRGEEERFDSALNDSLPRLEAALTEAADSSKILDGKQVFRLYDTYGLPFDFIEDLASERKLNVDEKGFALEMDKQRQKSRANQTFQRNETKDWTYASEERRQLLQQHEDRFEGYTTTRLNRVRALAIFDANKKEVAELESGSSGFITLERTPFYLESGGQVSDTGQVIAENGSCELRVTGMDKLTANGPRVHAIDVALGKLDLELPIRAEVDEVKRNAIRRNHTATHLLHAALRLELGPEVRQAGSLVEADRLRFDFTYSKPLTREQLSLIEKRINSQIYENYSVDTEVKSTDEAIREGAIALFNEKYGDQVRVVSVSNISIELCGGTHCYSTGQIGPFVINQESGVSAGVRRIEALTGDNAIAKIQKQRKELDAIIETLSVPSEQLVEAVEKLQTHTKNLGREIERLKIKAAMDEDKYQENSDTVKEIEGIKIVTQQVKDLKKLGLRTLADSIKDRLGSGVVILASEYDGRVSLLVSVTKDLTHRIHAGKIVKAIAPIVDGRGGGRPDFAEAGGRKPDGIKKLFLESRSVMSQMLKETT